MEDKIESVIKEYPVHVTGKRRIRGAILLETKEGLFTLVNYRDSLAKLQMEERVKAQLIDRGYRFVDKGITNSQGEWLTKDNYGSPYLMKQWYLGQECNLRETEDVVLAAGHLAGLHRAMVLPPESNVESVDQMPHSQYAETADSAPGDEERESESAKTEGENGMPESIKKITSEGVADTLSRHTREMKRVYNYIRNKKKRNDMEIHLLNQFRHFYEQAETAGEMLSEIDSRSMERDAAEQGRVCHGSYNYHNVLFMEKRQIATVNFGHCYYGLQLMDFYGFLRKLMEKNNWEKRRGIRAIEAYRQKCEWSGEEAKLLFILLLFPEKFWKQMNFYYNGKKAWMSMKNFDKLKKIEAQELARRKFLIEVKGVLF